MNLITNNELFLLDEIVRRNFTSKYKDSVLGIFWSVLRPLFMTILFTIIFSTIFGRSIEYYPVYFLSGRCIFEFFNGSIVVSLNSIKGNKNILTQTAAPKYIFILGGIISEFLNFIIYLLLLVVVMLVLGVPFQLILMPFSIIPIIATIIMVTGLGLMMSILGVYYTDVQHLWSVLSILFLYSCAMFYPMDIIPEPYHQYMVLNPLYWIIDQFRCFFYLGTIPSTLDMINLLLLSLIILIFGIIVFKKYEKRVTMKF